MDRRGVLALMGASALAACGGAIGPIGPDRVFDRDPVRFAGRQPTSFPVQGIDVARFQNLIQWDRVAEAGIRFAFIKATEGGDLLDPRFRENWRGAARAGIARGAYHFYYFCTEPEVQAAWFIRNVPKVRGSLPPVIDLEWNPFSPTCTLRPPAVEVRRVAGRFMDILTAHYGQRPVIYTTPDFYETNEMGRFSSDEFWLRATAKSLGEVYPGQRWVFWQYSMTGQMPGIGVDTDFNAFNGSIEDWQAWLARRSV